MHLRGRRMHQRATLHTRCRPGMNAVRLYHCCGFTLRKLVVWVTPLRALCRFCMMPKSVVVPLQGCDA